MWFRNLHQPATFVVMLVMVESCSHRYVWNSCYDKPNYQQGYHHPLSSWFPYACTNNQHTIVGHINMWMKHKDEIWWSMSRHQHACCVCVWFNINMHVGVWFRNLQSTNDYINTCCVCVVTIVNIVSQDQMALIPASRGQLYWVSDQDNRCVYV